MRTPNTAIIGHNLPADLKYLVEARFQKENVKFTHKWFKNRPTFDTQAIFKELHLRPHQEKLEKILAFYGIPHMHMHNAGNDAYYTLLTALKLADLTFLPPASDNKRKIDSLPPTSSKKTKGTSTTD
jgi:DNA polymerase III epsilon subunit-like protein